ncbi:GntR family transcriptional regulator [Alteribacter aurantiacus]|uniref:GntR family transcriptional regulator n=1 Tax=Alteribacter aurantiacus TaxID=254410 RepID=UPI00040CD740|nr:GntR family transcriptional regulator [Alteribacter aurantiacus]
MTLSFDHNRPIYIQVMEHVYGQVCRGELNPGDKLPSVREMAVSAGVNPNTISRTYMEMEREKVVESKRGQGTFVTNNQSVIDELKVSAAKKETERFVGALSQYGYTEKEMELLLSDYLSKRGEGNDRSTNQS